MIKKMGKREQDGVQITLLPTTQYAPPMWRSGKGDREVPGGFVDATNNLSHRGARLVE